MKHYYIFEVNYTGVPKRLTLYGSIHKIHLTKDAYHFVRSMKAQARLNKTTLVAEDFDTEQDTSTIRKKIEKLNVQSAKKYLHENRI